MYQIFSFSQLQASHLLELPFFLLVQSLLSTHCPHPSYFLIGLYPRPLKPLDRFLQLLPYPRIFPRQFYNPTQPILCPNPQFTQPIIEIVQLRIIWYVRIGHFYFVILVIFVYGDQAATLPFGLHFLEDFYEVLEFVLQFFGGVADQRWQFLYLSLFYLFIIAHANCSFRLILSTLLYINLPPLYLLMNPLSRCLRVYLLLLLVQNGYNLLLSICQVLISLVSGIEVELTHLVRLHWYLYGVDDFYEFVHAQQVLQYFAFMEGDQDEVMDIFFFVF